MSEDDWLLSDQPKIRGSSIFHSYCDPVKAISIPVKNLRSYLNQGKTTGKTLHVELYDPDDHALNEGHDALIAIAKVIEPDDGFTYILLDDLDPKEVWSFNKE